MSEGAKTLADWVIAAACRKTPELFDDVELPGVDRQARAVCARCPVLVQCAAYATAVRPTWGVWAGKRWTLRGRGLEGFAS